MSESERKCLCGHDESEHDDEGCAVWFVVQLYPTCSCNRFEPLP